jgi:hypothetical protein
MSSFSDPSAEALAIAGSAVASALVDLLIERGVLTAADGHTVCQRAQGRIRDLIGVRGDMASALIEEMIRSLPQK